MVLSQLVCEIERRGLESGHARTIIVDIQFYINLF
jgi:hypothetical protein